ncbi:MAG TPA: hypothetical protein VMV40_00670 [Acidiferrobacter sp.]|nr:hypothetical protein [Acidiferrobacter sp.]
MTTWIERAARKRSMGQIVLFLLVTGIVAMLLALNGPYWKAFFHDPVRIGTPGLEAAARASNSYQPITTPFVTVTGDKVVNTGVTEVTTYDELISHVSAGYYALRVGNRILIVKSPKVATTTMTGSLGPMPYDLTMQLFPKGTDPALENAVYPLLLETDYRESGFVAIFWALLAETVFGFFAWRSWRRLTGRVEHPAVTRARAWGDLALTSANVERELGSAVTAKSRGWILTPDYVVKLKLFSFDLFRMENLVWAYKRVTKRSINFIPTGKGYTADLTFSDGAVAIEGRRKRVDEWLALAAKRAPWAVSGYSDEINTLYRKSKEEFVAHVMNRKQEMGR